MKNFTTLKDSYLLFCKNQKCLDQKTLKTYGIDLKQFLKMIHTDSLSSINTNLLENYICQLHQIYKPQTAKRKFGRATI